MGAGALTDVLESDLQRACGRYWKPSGLTRREIASWKLANLTNAIFRREFCNGGLAIQFCVIIFDQFMKFRTK